MTRSSGKMDSNFVEQLILYIASAALSSLVLYVGLRQLDPNRDSSKKALEHKRELAKRLGCPLIQTNQYEVQAAINGISKLFFSRIRNLQPDSQDINQRNLESDSE